MLARTATRAVATGIAVACVLFASGCGYEVEVLAECPSPTDQYIATFYRVFGGGAAGFMYEHVNVRLTGTAFDAQSYVLQLKEGYDAQLSWQDPRTLQVTYPSDARVDSAASHVLLGDSIALEYVSGAGESGRLEAGTGCATGRRHRAAM